MHQTFHILLLVIVRELQYVVFMTKLHDRSNIWSRNNVTFNMILNDNDVSVSKVAQKPW